MRACLVAKLFLLLGIIALPNHVLAQCADWYPGGFVDGGAVNGVDGSVRAVFAWDHDGEPFTASYLVIGGQFTSVQGVAAANVALRDPATGNWQPLGAGITGIVECFTAYNGELVVGGSFTHAGGTPANYVARWNGSVWQTLPNGINPDGTDGPVFAMSVYGGKLVVGGSFTTAGGPASFHRNIASWNPTTYWEGLGIGVGCINGNCGSGWVMAMTQYNGELLVGGSFGAAGNEPIQYFARWNGTQWLAPAGGKPNSYVTALQPYYGGVIVAGDFSQIHFDPSGHIDVANVARWASGGWQGLGAGLSQRPSSLTVYQGELIAAGSFSLAGGSAANRIARWNGSSWSTLDSGLAGSGGIGLAVYGAELIVGGIFTSAGGVPANNLARWSGADWAPYGGGSASIVYAMSSFAGRPVIAGSFNQPAGVNTAFNIARWDGTGLDRFGSGTNASIVALESFKYAGFSGDYELIAGGLFTTAGGVGANYIARWNQDPVEAFPPPAWQPMGAGFNSGVYAIERHSGVTYAGGGFTFSGLTSRNRIARWNETSDVWEALGTGMNGAVRAMQSYGGSLYVGGEFTTAGGIATGGLARWDGSAWRAVGGTFAGSVWALAVHDGKLVIAGSFPGINASPNLANYDGTTYSTYSVGGANGRVRALYSTGDRLYIGGDFSTAGGSPASRVAYWDGSSWHGAEGGVNDTVLALLGYQGEVHAGGLFTSADAGTVPSPRWARFSETGLPWFTRQPTSTTKMVGDSATFTSLIASGYGAASYQWYHYGAPLTNGTALYGSTIAGANASALQISGIVGADLGDYWVEVTTACGTRKSNVARLTMTGVTSAEPATGTTVFEAIGPNPVSSTTQMRFALVRTGHARFRLYNLAGRLVREIDLGVLPAGRHQALWDVRDRRGIGVTSGVYLVSFEVDGERVDQRRVTVLR